MTTLTSTPAVGRAEPAARRSDAVPKVTGEFAYSSDLQAAGMYFMSEGMKNPLNALSGSYDFMHLFGHTVVGFMWASSCLDSWILEEWLHSSTCGVSNDSTFRETYGETVVARAGGARPRMLHARRHCDRLREGRMARRRARARSRRKSCGGTR